MKRSIFNGLSFATLISLTSLSAHASPDIQELNWKGIPVTYLEDSRLPTYQMSVYFADGALSDEGGIPGETNAMFKLLSSGTRRYSQKDIADNLEFYGASYGGNVTHEYSTYGVSGLIKDMVPTLKKICHLFQDANFPQNEIEKEQERARSALLSLVNDHSALASRAFREIQLAGSKFSYPVEGKLADIKKFNQKGLQAKLDYFNKKVAKHIYITGPSAALDSKEIFLNDCGWSSEADFKRELGKLNVPKVQNGPEISLIVVKDANQAQVRMGQYLPVGEIEDAEALALTSEYLGGGFTSVLMREVRVRRGLTYSIGSFAARQKYYGRSGISTFTRNETAGALFGVIKNILEQGAAGEIADEDFERVKNAFIGSYPFSLESSGSYLSQLMSFDHIDEPYSRLSRFPEIIKGIKKDEMVQTFKNIFDWNNMRIVVVGDESLEKELSKFGKVKKFTYQNFL